MKKKKIGKLDEDEFWWDNDDNYDIGDDDVDDDTVDDDDDDDDDDRDENDNNAENGYNRDWKQFEKEIKYKHWKYSWSIFSFQINSYSIWPEYNICLCVHVNLKEGCTLLYKCYFQRRSIE